MVPGQAGRTYTTRPPLRERAWIALERLHAFHRQNEPQARVVEFGSRADEADALGVPVDDAIELCRLRESPLTSVAAACAFAAQRADLNTDPTAYEPREPVAIEHARVAPAED